mgnify:CR=1 FL=1
MNTQHRTIRERASKQLQISLPSFLAQARLIQVALACVTEYGRGCPAFDKYEEADEAWNLANTLSKTCKRLGELSESLAQDGGDK